MVLSMRGPHSSVVDTWEFWALLPMGSDGGGVLSSIRPSTCSSLALRSTDGTSTTTSTSTDCRRELSIAICVCGYCGIYVLVKVPAGVLHGNYWARGKFEKVM